jgi:hypothetical protein
MIVSDLNDLGIKVVANSLPEAEESIGSRHAILATLPLPVGIPSDALRPILIPPSYTLHEFLASAIGALRTAYARRPDSLLSANL